MLRRRGDGRESRRDEAQGVAALGAVFDASSAAGVAQPLLGRRSPRRMAPSEEVPDRGEAMGGQSGLSTPLEHHMPKVAGVQAIRFGSVEVMEELALLERLHGLGVRWVVRVSLA